MPDDYPIGGMTCYRTLLSDYHYDWLQREIVRPYYYRDNERLPQYQTEAVFRARLPCRCGFLCCGFGPRRTVEDRA